MNQKPYLLVTATVFLVVAAAHLTRLVVGWGVVVAGRSAPHWISVPGLVVPAVLSVWGFRLASRSRPGA